MPVSSKTIIRFIVITLCLFALFAQSVNLQAEDQVETKTVVVIGTGKILKEDSATGIPASNISKL